MTHIVEKYDNFFQRLFEIIPGLFIWILLLAPIWGGFSFPLLIINVFLLLTVYWLYRATLLAVGSFIGFVQYKIDIKKNWMDEIKKLDIKELPDYESLPTDLIPNQLIVIANYGEDYSVLSRSIKAIMNQNYPKEKL